MTTKTCCICNRPFTEWGNNPTPFPVGAWDSCCDDCDHRWVTPARVASRTLTDDELKLCIYFARQGAMFVESHKVGKEMLEQARKEGKI